MYKWYSTNYSAIGLWLFSDTTIYTYYITQKNILQFNKISHGTSLNAVNCKSATINFLNMSYITIGHVICQPLLGLLSWCPVLQLIWRSGTRRFHLRVPDLQMNCSDMTWRSGTRTVVPVMATKVTCPIYINNLLIKIEDFHREHVVWVPLRDGKVPEAVGGQGFWKLHRIFVC